MAARSGLACDRCKRPATEAKKYDVTVSLIPDIGDPQEVLSQEIDLCDRDLTRLLDFVHRGLDTDTRPKIAS